MTWTLAAATRLAAVAIIFAVIAALTACGGGRDDDSGSSDTSPTDSPALTIDDAAYFTDLEAALTQVNEELTTLDDMRTEAFGENGDAEAVAVYGDAFEQFMADRDDAVRALTAPEALKGEHAALTRATSDTLDWSSQVNDALHNDPPASETGLSDLLYELDAASITQRFRDACTVLQLRAASSNITVDLQCLR